MHAGDDNDHRDQGADVIRLLRAGRPRRGQALVEFALVIPIFLLLLFGIIDFSRFVYGNNALNEVAREAARQGTVARRPVVCASLARVACVQTLVQTRVTAINVATADITVICYRIPQSGAAPLDVNQPDTCGLTWKGGDLVKVHISTSMWFVTPLMGQFLSPTIQGDTTWITVNG